MGFKSTTWRLSTEAAAGHAPRVAGCQASELESKWTMRDPRSAGKS